MYLERWSLGCGERVGGREINGVFKFNYFGMWKNLVMEGLIVWY